MAVARREVAPNPLTPDEILRHIDAADEHLGLLEDRILQDSRMYPDEDLVFVDGMLVVARSGLEQIRQFIAYTRSRKAG